MKLHIIKKYACIIWHTASIVYYMCIQGMVQG